MNKLIDIFKRKMSNEISSQDDLIKFVKNKDNLKKAAEGSMQKRVDLIKRVETLQSSYPKQ